MEHKPDLPLELSDDQLDEIAGGARIQLLEEEAEETETVSCRNTGMNSDMDVAKRLYYFNPERDSPLL